jgi:hypothetical protein
MRVLGRNGNFNRISNCRQVDRVFLRKAPASYFARFLKP